MTRSETLPDDRPLGQAMLRGLRCLCPSCGEGRIMNGYLTLHKACPACGEDLSHQRTDDGPAYLTIVIVGHLLVPLLVPAYTLWDLHPALMATLFSALAVALSLYLLPRLKGALIGFQWAKKMHGF